MSAPRVLIGDDHALFARRSPVSSRVSMTWSEKPTTAKGSWKPRVG